MTSENLWSQLHIQKLKNVYIKIITFQNINERYFHKSVEMWNILN